MQDLHSHKCIWSHLMWTQNMSSVVTTWHLPQIFIWMPTLLGWCESSIKQSRQSPALPLPLQHHLPICQVPFAGKAAWGCRQWQCLHLGQGGSLLLLRVATDLCGTTVMLCSVQSKLWFRPLHKNGSFLFSSDPFLLGGLKTNFES